MSDGLGCEIYLKLEAATPIGAFKVRGGLNLLSQLSGAERVRGVITASTGNQGQSIADAARTFGVRAIIAAPEAANPDKAASMRRLGAKVVLTGRDFDAARGRAHAGRPAARQDGGVDRERLQPHQGTTHAGPDGPSVVVGASCHAP
jgi:threonine dehydratase